MKATHGEFEGCLTKASRYADEQQDSGSLRMTTLLILDPQALNRLLARWAYIVRWRSPLANPYVSVTSHGICVGILLGGKLRATSSWRQQADIDPRTPTI